MIKIYQRYQNIFHDFEIIYSKSNIFTPSYKSVIYEVLTCDILTRLSLRIACSDFSEFMVTYHMTIFGKLLILSKLLKLRFYNG